MTATTPYGPQQCPSCRSQVRIAILVVRTPDNRLDTKPLALDPTPVDKTDATVVLITVRPDEKWIVAPVTQLDLIPPSMRAGRRCYRAHVCAQLPDVWIDSSALLSGVAAGGAS